MRSYRKNRHNHASSSRRRRGGVTLELLFNLPIWIICLAATIEFGLLQVNLQHLAQASRVGAEDASLTPGLPTSGNTPSELVDAVTRELRSIGILGASEDPCDVVLQHNSGSVTTLHRSGATCTADLSGLPDLLNLPVGTTYVRVVVFVEMNQLTPNLLSTLGYDISGRFARQSTTFRYQSS